MINDCEVDAITEKPKSIIVKPLSYFNKALLSHPNALLSTPVNEVFWCNRGRLHLKKDLLSSMKKEDCIEAQFFIIGVVSECAMGIYGEYRSYQEYKFNKTYRTCTLDPNRPGFDAVLQRLQEYSALMKYYPDMEDIQAKFKAYIATPKRVGVYSGSSQVPEYDPEGYFKEHSRTCVYAPFPVFDAENNQVLEKDIEVLEDDIVELNISPRYYKFQPYPGDFKEGLTLRMNSLRILQRGLSDEDSFKAKAIDTSKASGNNMDQFVLTKGGMY